MESSFICSTERLRPLSDTVLLVDVFQMLPSISAAVVQLDRVMFDF